MKKVVSYSKKTKQAKIKQFTLIRDGRTLRGLIKQGCINEAKYGMYPQIDHNNDDDWRFTFRDINYELKYIDGSIYPMLFETKTSIVANVDLIK
mgnify:FL=1